MKRHPVQIDDDLWAKLWAEARESKTPKAPAQVVRDILTNYFRRKERRKVKPK